MPDEAVKRRRRGAILAAIKILEKRGYEVSRPHHPIYDLIAIKPRDVCKIKICLDKLSGTDLKSLQQLSADAVFSREAWIYTSSRGKGEFEIKFI